MRPVIQSYKQVKFQAEASITAGTQNNITMAVGVDSYSGPSAANNEIPTGAMLKSLSIQVPIHNLVNIASNVTVALQHNRSGQGNIGVTAVGGNPQRNNIHKTVYRAVGQNQNTNINMSFKIPRQFWRIREGDVWTLSILCSTISNQSAYIIYKFYR